MLEETIASQIEAYFLHHPVLGRRVNEVCIALTGSFAFGLGGKGADVDAKVLCPSAVYEAVKAELIAAGRIPAGGEPEEEFPDVVGDYTLESLSTVWPQVERYDDLTALFIYGNLIYLLGNRALLDPLVSHCRNIPPEALSRETERERTNLDQALYAFLRSFQTADPVARLLARAGMARTAMRLAFMAEGVAPPYDKHLFRLLQRLERGKIVAGLVRRFLADDDGAYVQVAATEDWHAMYECAARTPAVRFRSAVLTLLDQRG
jgi:hypothetical protein